MKQRNRGEFVRSSLAPNFRELVEVHAKLEKQHEEFLQTEFYKNLKKSLEGATVERVIVRPRRKRVLRKDTPNGRKEATPIKVIVEVFSGCKPITLSYSEWEANGSCGKVINYIY